MIQDIYPSEFHFSGHETFHLRYTWLPKAADYLKKNSDGVSLSKYDIINYVRLHSFTFVRI